MDLESGKKEEISSKEVSPHFIFTYDLKNLPPVKKIEVSHKLFGHAQTKNGKKYEFLGIIKAMKGYQLGRGAIMVSENCKEDMIRFLESYSIKYQTIKVYKKEE